MSSTSSIEWTQATWNPVTGCDRVSAGCDHCYALTLAKRLKAMGNPRYQNDGTRKTSGPGFGVTLHHDQLDLPLRWRKPRTVFVNSMSDLFHSEVPDSFIEAMWETMAYTPQHTYQILTKRPRRMRDLFSGKWEGSGLLPNVWLGTSVENQEWADKRVPLLLETPAAVRFLSCEPLLGPIELTAGYHDYLGANSGHQAWKVEPAHAPGCNCAEASYYGETPTCPIPEQVATERVDWVIVGGESGPGARPMHPDWPRSLRDQCVSAGVPYFFKQWGGRTPKAGGRMLDGRTWDELPTRQLSASVAAT